MDNNTYLIKNESIESFLRDNLINHTERGSVLPLQKCMYIKNNYGKDHFSVISKEFTSIGVDVDFVYHFRVIKHDDVCYKMELMDIELSK
jgi:hypothetical protein